MSCGLPSWCDGYDHVVAVDAEFIAAPGALPTVVCVVATDLRTGKTDRYWTYDQPTRCPWHGRVLIIAYYAIAEVSAFLALGWDLPVDVLDLYCEFRVLTNGVDLDHGAGLVGALAFFGLPAMTSDEKSRMRNRILAGGPFGADDRDEILSYCESDVRGLTALVGVMAPHISFGAARVRGRFMVAAAKIERFGIPIDVAMYEGFQAQWPHVRTTLLSAVDHYGVFDGTTFVAARWEEYVEGSGIRWPRLPTGRLALDRDTFREMKRCHPEIAPIHEVRETLAQLRSGSFTIGPDRRNRTMLSAFRSRTGRNQPSTTYFAFGAPKWMRGFIQPREGHALAYLDYSQQEFGIAAALSGDADMRAAYREGDPYLALARRVGAVPADATKRSHPAAREKFKTCVLGVQYGMTLRGLADRLGSMPQASEVMTAHQRIFRRYWEWSQASVDYALLSGRLFTTLGWQVRVHSATNHRFLRNFLLQGNGAEILRLACVLATERGLPVCAPVHDALLVEAPVDQIMSTARAVRDAMESASEMVLNGFRLVVDEPRIAVYPDRLAEHASPLWQRVVDLLDDGDRRVLVGGVGDGAP